MMVQSRRNQIILVTVAIIVVIPIAIYFILRENFFLMRLSTDNRVTLEQPKPLDRKDPSYLAIRDAIAANSVGVDQASPKASYKEDIDGDEKGDRISATPSKLSLRLSRSDSKYRQRFLTLENISSVGLNDIDGDGKGDAWFTRGGKSETDVIWGDGKGHLVGKQMLTYEDSERSWKGGRTTFFDVDRDGRVELVFEKGSSEVKGALYWINLSTVKK